MHINKSPPSEIEIIDKAIINTGYCSKIGGATKIAMGVAIIVEIKNANPAKIKIKEITVAPTRTPQ